MVNEYRGYVEQADNIDGAYALARLAPKYMAEGAWELRRMLCSSVHHLDDWDRAYAFPRLAELRGPGLTPRLPDAVRDFPGHGLVHGAEERWLEGWGTVKGRPGQPLWYVSHGHRTVTGAVLVVSTWRPADTDRNGFQGLAEALAQARVDSLAGALHLAFPTGPEGNPEAEAAFRAAGRLTPGCGWPTRLGIEVDQKLTGFEVQRAGGAWAAVAEHGPLAIGVYGHGSEPGAEPLAGAPL